MFIAPILPMNPDALMARLLPHMDYAMVDALNYRQQAAALFRQHGWDYALTDDYAQRTAARLNTLLGGKSQGT